jgi:Protein of unknown function (DUF1592)/Protein of unknown function (DUF1588)/Protein of unknown function (DUF1587)/Protein of unknown function (DUF1595)/Protein of unknown function (DUF1585)
LTALLAVACEGRFSATGSKVGSTPPTPTGSQPPAVDGDPPSPASDKPCVEPEVQSGAPLRRLTHREFNNTVRDLLGDTSQPGNAFEGQGTVLGFDNNIGVLGVNENQALKYGEVAEALATKATQNVGQFLQCDVAAKGENACFTEWLNRFGEKAFRQPLSAEDVTRWTTLYTATKASLGFQSAVQTVTAGLLQSSRFLYRVEPHQLDGKTPSTAPLEGHAMAARLSYFLWESMPDATLLSAAQKGELATAEAVSAQVARMLKDPKATVARKHFHQQWLELATLENTSKDAQVFPEFTPAAKVAMAEQFDRFVEDVYTKDNASVDALLTRSKVQANKDLSVWFPQAAGATGWIEVDRDPTLHAGFLTLPGLLASHANVDATSPTKRGKFMLERLLCGLAPEPPPDANVTPPKVTPNTSARQRYAEHTSVPSCAGCHRFFDPMGLALENFDGIGRYRKTEGTAIIDLTGEFYNTDIDGEFVGIVDGVKKLTTSKMLHSCVVTNWFRFAQGRIESKGESCQLQAMRKQLTDSRNMQEVVTNIATSNAFRLGGAQ